jgi:CHAT domain-containing protein
VPSFAGRPVSVVPSATLWLDACSRSAPAADRVVVVAGPGLPGARDEAMAVADIHPTARRLLDRNATASVVSAALDGATLVHVAAHGRLRSDNPFFSSLILHDGPLTVYDLERLAHAPRHVVLAACEIARSQSVAVEEVLGLAAALLAAGTVSLVAPVLSVVDAAVVSLMVHYHTELRTGRAPAAALAAAQEKAAASGPAGWAAAAAFICMGAGGTSVQPVSAPVANCS